MKWTMALALLVACSRGEIHEEEGAAGQRTMPIVLVPGENLDLEVRGDGLFALAGSPLPTDDATLARLSAWRVASPHAHLRIMAHPATVHGRLVRAYELVQLANIPPAQVELLPVRPKTTQR